MRRPTLVRRTIASGPPYLEQEVVAAARAGEEARAGPVAPRARASPAIAARGRLLARLRSRRASAPQHTAFLLTILTASIYNAAGYYFTVFSQRYEKGVDEQIKQAQLEPPKGC